MEDLSNIWNDEDKLNEDQLLNYIKGNSTADEKHTVENKMNNSALMNDAVEGLQQFSSAGKANDYAHQINTQLKQQLHQKHKNKNKFYPTNISWQIIATVIIILLCLIGFVILKMIRR